MNSQTVKLLKLRCLSVNSRKKLGMGVTSVFLEPVVKETL